ncbi:MAG: DMT family transporter [Candidatus Bathyarchaeia archaeon]|jgi:drug/metabolite transporter (DMT)-like permease
MALDWGIALAVAAMVSWGVADFLAKKAIDQIGYRASIVINQVVAFLPILLIAALFFKLPSFTPLLASETVLAGATGVIGYIFLYRGLGNGNVSVVAPITASWSVITVLLAAFLFAEALTPLQIAGVVAVFIGVFFASTNLEEFKKSIKTGGWSAGAADALIAMVAWGISYALLKPITSAIGPVMALFLLKILAVAALLSWTGVTKTKISLPVKTIFLFLAMAGLLDFSAYLAFNFSLNTQYVSVVSAIVATAPAITIGLAYVFLKERVVRNQKLGIIAILVGLVLISLI